MTDQSAPHGVQEAFRLALEEGHFLIQCCDDCRRHVYFPRELCPHCGGGSLQAVEPCGQGRVHAVTTVRRKPQDGGDLNVSLIELAEGVRLMSRVEGVAPDQVAIGMAVKARVTNGLVLFDVVEAR